MKTNKLTNPYLKIHQYTILLRRSTLSIFVFLFVLFSSFTSDAQNSRALIIGIDIYKPASEKALNPSRSIWRNLGGCVNDAGAMRDLVISRYGFPEANIKTLLNQEAARERIINELKHLISISQKGDIVLIYYAGHGSQMTNSLSKEQDKKDETIVPADAYKGARDIRDKELAGYFNELLDKGVVLTVIFDSCHSGSAGRGQLYEITGIRNLDADPNDAADSTNPQKPEERGALVISAAQDFEFAKELSDENKVMHGAFTLALLKSIQQNGAGATVENIFSGVGAIMKYYGKTQEPVLAGSLERKKGGLFGTLKASHTTAIPVLETKGEKIELMGGYAFGLSVGQLLKPINSTDTVVITEMVGANRSLAKKVSVSKVSLSPGTLLEVISWTSSVNPSLKIYIPGNVIDQKQLIETIASLKSLRVSRPALLVNDVSSLPSRLIHYGNNSWWYQPLDGERIEEKSLNKLLNRNNEAAFVNLPPEQKFAYSIIEYFTKFNTIEIVDQPGEALYSLVGRINEKNEPEYGFVRNNFGNTDSLDILPLRTDFEFYDLSKSDPSIIVEKLAEHAFKIARIRNWMMLQPPAGINKFPYLLEVAHYRTNKKAEDGIVHVRDTLSFFISKDTTAEKWNRKKRYVYVFSIDAHGAMKLMYPSIARGNVENRFPVTNAANNTETRSKLFDILVKPPAGNDAYFMLSSEEAISNLSAFQQAGVISRGPEKLNNAMESLLYTGTKSRNRITTPMTWSIEKIVLHIIPSKK